MDQAEQLRNIIKANNIEIPIKLTINGDYLEGELNHLSGYALVGNIVEKDAINNPKVTNITLVSLPTSLKNLSIIA